MNVRFLRHLAAGALLSVGMAGSGFAAECIAPANPGGGWDFTCRAIGKIMFERLIPLSLQQQDIDFA